ncbi:exodeoxyribonuclease III [Bartonella sp. DGB1]|uniref:exodeoxyribonuclease III n=1 Tax=Bartonella sp. DGB1 TaxID=3239807 RepID=UPI003523C1CD
MSLSIVSWNINSIRFRLNLVNNFILEANPDIICLQEIKCENKNFPYDFFKTRGYSYMAIDGQKSYHGVAILSKYPFKLHKINKFCNLNDCRHIAVLLSFNSINLWINNLYVPAGGDEPNPNTNPKFAHKLAFLEEIKQFKSKQQGDYHLLLGDFNIAPLEQDVWDHKKLLKVVSHTPIETELLTTIYQQGNWYDLIRDKLGQDTKLFSWWSYRSPNWEKADKGRRLDHIWGAKELKDKITTAKIWKSYRNHEKPSDHVPVEIKLKLNAL